MNIYLSSLIFLLMYSYFSTILIEDAGAIKCHVCHFWDDVIYTCLPADQCFYLVTCLKYII